MCNRSHQLVHVEKWADNMQFLETSMQLVHWFHSWQMLANWCNMPFLLFCHLFYVDTSIQVTSVCYCGSRLPDLTKREGIYWTSHSAKWCLSCVSKLEFEIVIRLGDFSKKQPQALQQWVSDSHSDTMSTLGWEFRLQFLGYCCTSYEHVHFVCHGIVHWLPLLVIYVAFVASRNCKK